ncbi:MAG: endolytic transglycosylase MltG [Thermoleophilaceae bacterium]
MSGGPPPVPGGRSPEEREASRREREARRAGGGAPAGDGWLERARELTAARAEATGAPPPPPRRGGNGRVRVLLALGGGAGAILLAWLLISLFQPFGGDGGGRTQVVVPRGAGVGEIADLLDRRGVVSSSFFFSLRAHLSGRGDELKAGVYTLRKDMSYGAALDALAKGPRPDIVTLTIPEGRSRREIAGIVGHSLRGDYLAASRRSRALDPREYGARQVRDLEGFLFPATFRLKRGRPVSLLVEQQLSAFRSAFEQVDLRRARRKNLTPYDVLIIASLVEREAQVAKDRPLVASVIYNRLHDGMPLQIDATIRYATGNWQRPLKRSELGLRSPYNTYRRHGLPPGPIGNPGLASIRAAAHPARTHFLYYVVKPCGNGSHSFARTDAEFQRLFDRYNRARAGRGGRSPADC